LVSVNIFISNNNNSNNLLFWCRCCAFNKFGNFSKAQG